MHEGKKLSFSQGKSAARAKLFKVPAGEKLI